ncbi:hypothetical protein LTS08_003385 [Lithohypha guttulata]|uniref:NTF2-like domain-containing protein n=1 Tax=Lithohypha guttulata TaxID=1690604 RepID=A0AAN7SZP3_9EURO|nr:hypothetical protein LTR05_004437 [Lithohypha guttulata]KAK5103961.1 hypothetical protein LTS08_003385 [Lithohypha guttulata]
MKLSTVFLFATSAVAIPWGNWQKWNKPSTTCLTYEQALYIQERSRVFQLKANLTDARLAGEELFAAQEYKQYGHSINSLRGDALGTLVEPDGVTYVANVLSAPPLYRIDSLAMLHNCTHIMEHWDFYGVGGARNNHIPVRGFALTKVDLTRETQPVVWRQVEFNSMQWANNTGFTIEFPTTGPYAPQPE